MLDYGNPDQANREQLEAGAGQWTASDAQPLQPVDSDTGLEQLRYGFCIGGWNFLVNQNEDSELLKTPRIYPLPKSPAWYRGLINLRGNIVSVFDLKHMYSNEVAPGTDYNVLVLGKNDKAVGVMIDGLPKSLRIKAEHEPLADCKEIRDAAINDMAIADNMAAYIEGICSIEGRQWMEFDYKRFLLQQISRVKPAEASM